MEHVMSFLLLMVAVSCVMVATRPTRPTTRRRSTPVFSAYRNGEDVVSTSIPSTTGAGNRRRWTRQDLQRALTREHAIPGADQDIWPTR